MSWKAAFSGSRENLVPCLALNLRRAGGRAGLIRRLVAVGWCAGF